MNIYTGKSVFSGIAIGKIKYLKRKKQRINKRRIENIEAELKRFDEAKWYACEQLAELYRKALQDVGEEEARIFDVHKMLLQDEDYVRHVYYIIRNMKVNAEYAVSLTCKSFVRVFEEMDDEYLKARSADVQDVSDLVIRILCGDSGENSLGEESVIAVAEDFAPSETIQFDKSKLLAFVTRKGSVKSHTAILARTMSIPALIGVESDESWDGKMAIVDGKNNKIILEPDEAVLEEYLEEKRKEDEKKKSLENLKGVPTVTSKGKKIHLYANMGTEQDMESVHANDAEGIGLFRSEFIYIEKDNYPSEEEQFQIYKKAVEMMEGKKVIIRTLDIGADKKVSYIGMENEENPAMGYRAIRICLDQVEVFKAQLRAIYRASAYGTVSIMFPLIISMQEVKKIKAICQEVKEELDQKDVKYGDVELGSMIETPAAAIISDLLAKEVDFFSIGTNDLTQYVLAADRQNPKLDAICESEHPAILRLIQMVIDNGHKEGCWVGVCGESVADITRVAAFVEMGIDEISVPPAFILPIRKLIREM